MKQQAFHKILLVMTLALPAFFALAGSAWAMDTDFGDGITVDATLDAVDVNVGDNICADNAGNCTLRAAIEESNFTAGLQDIILPAGTYLLTIAGIDEDLSATGDLDITDNVTLTGAGSALSVINGNGVNLGDRVFHIADPAGLGVAVIFDGIKVTGGSVLNVNGGGIWVQATEPAPPATILEPVVISLTLRNSEVSFNLASSNMVDPVTGKLIGGAGGGIYSSTQLIVENSRISENTAVTNGGGLYAGGQVTLSDSLIAANMAEGGGGVFETGNHISTYTNCAVVANVAVGGGGFSVRAQVSLEFLNCTIDGNTATDVGAGMQSSGLVNLIYCTVTSNQSASDAPNGGAALNSFASGSFRLWSTLIEGNVVASAGTPEVRNCGCSGGSCTPMIQFLSLDYNLEDVDSCRLNKPHDLPNTMAGIGPLDSSQTLAPVRPLLANSAAIDVGDPSICPMVDQRGVIRPIDGNEDLTLGCDIGAFEFNPVLFTDGFETGDTMAWSLTIGLAP